MDKLERMKKSKIPGPETGIEIRKSICAICDPTTQCGLDCYVSEERIIKVEGSKENPHSRGTLCSKGAATRQYVYNEDRIRTPLKRVGPRGSGQFEPISWDEALETITANLERLKAESGPESVVFFVGYPKQMRPFVQRLALQYGSPNYATESSTCHTATAMAFQLVFGQEAGPDVYNTRCLLVWSANPLHSNTPSAGHLLDARDRGMKLIVVDPRKSPLASLADVHLQLKPGTDGALALGMAHVIIHENLYDRDFVAEYTRGFQEYRAYVDGFDPERVEGITGVPADKIREAARLYATSKPAALKPSASPIVQHTNGVQNYRAVFSLIGLTGNFDVAGGNMADPVSWLEISGGGFTTRQHEFEMPRQWAELPPRLGAERFPVWAELVNQGQAMDMQRQIRTGEPYPLRGLMAFGMNYHMFADSNGVLEAIQKLDFICDMDLFLTDTAKYADIVLPASSSLERSELRCYPEKYVVLTEPVIAPVGESRSDTDIVFDLARRAQVGRSSPQPGARWLSHAGRGVRRRLGLAARAEWHERGRAQESSQRHVRPDPTSQPGEKVPGEGFSHPQRQDGVQVFPHREIRRPVGIERSAGISPATAKPRGDPGAGQAVSLYPQHRLAPTHVRAHPHLPAPLDA